MLSWVLNVRAAGCFSSSQRWSPVSAIRSRSGVAGLVLPFCNSETMALRPVETSLPIPPGARAVVLMDQAGWHTTDTPEMPRHITCVALRDKCSELNPAGHIRQFIRGGWRSNHILTSHDTIIDQGCEG